jgi:hypothetical protein
MRWKKWLEMIRNGGNDMEISWISKLRWNKWLDMGKMTWISDEYANWDETND